MVCNASSASETLAVPHRLTEHSLLAAQAFHPTSCSQHEFVASEILFIPPILKEQHRR